MRAVVFTQMREQHRYACKAVKEMRGMKVYKFDGSTTAFTMQSAGVNVSPQNEENCIISISGVIQEPGTAYTVSGSTITFTGAPASTDTFFGVVLGDSLDIGTPSDSTVSAVGGSADAGNLYS